MSAGTNRVMRLSLFVLIVLCIACMITIIEQQSNSYVIKLITAAPEPKSDILYVFLNGGVRKGDHLSSILLHLEENKKDYLVFADDINYKNQSNVNYVRVPTKHMKHLLQYPSFLSIAKGVIINYMWTQALEYLIDSGQMEKYKAFLISEDDIEICNQSLLDEFAVQFIKDSTMNALHLWDSCGLQYKRPIVRKWGKFHLFRKNTCGGVSTMLKPRVLESILECMYQGKQKEKAWDGPQGGFVKCKMHTFYPNEVLVIHVGQYHAGLEEAGDRREKNDYLNCNQTLFKTQERLDRDKSQRPH